MRILLINPPKTLWESTFSVPTGTMPLGLGYIASYLRKMGYKEIELLDAGKVENYPPKKVENGTFFGMPTNEIVKRALDFKPDLIGISSLFSVYYIDAVFTAEALKEVMPDVPVVLGGPHASAFQKELMKHPAIDAAVKGEGEVAFYQIAKCIEEGRDFKDVPNTASRVSGEVCINEYTEVVKDLDEYPMPAYDLIDIDYYLSTEVNGYIREPPAFPIITSRGCPMKCVYCTVRMLYGRSWRHHSAKRVCDDIEYLMKTYGFREFHFHDDSISANRTHLTDICNEIIERKLNISWTTPNGIAHWTLDEDMLKLMKRAGCYRVTFGIESGNAEVRTFVGKGGQKSLDQAKRLIKYANKIGLWTVSTHIFGFPYETKDQMMDTIRYSVESDVDFAVFYTLGYYPRTPVYEIAKKEGLIDFEDFLDPTKKDSWVHLSRGINQDLKSKYFTADEVGEINSYAYGYFFKRRIISFLNPIRLIRKLWGVKEFKYGMRLFFRGLTLITRFFKQGGRFSSYGIHFDEDEKGTKIASDPNAKSTEV